jgi:hypothetical protein
MLPQCLLFKLQVSLAGSGADLSGQVYAAPVYCLTFTALIIKSRTIKKDKGFINKPHKRICDV